MASHQQTLSSRLSDIFRAVKKAFSPEAKYPYVPGNVEVEASPDLLGDIEAMGFKDYQTLLAFLNAAVTGTVNDNDLLLENLIQLLAKLPPNSKEGKQLTDGLLTQLWGTLDHPPNSTLDSRFKYRSADGSGNNIHNPELGAANTPYARTVAPMTFQNPNQPDPSVIFDSLMARGEEFHPHPQGISSMLFYLASIIIHDIFQTVSATACFSLLHQLQKDVVGKLTSDSPPPTTASISPRRIWTYPPCTVEMRWSKRLCGFTKMVSSSRTASAPRGYWVSRQDAACCLSCSIVSTTTW